MSVSAISSSSDPYSTAIQGAAAQRRQDVQALATALKSGDLTAAQSAFAGLQSAQRPSSTSQGGQSNQSTAQSSNLQALASALQSGDIAGAQTAFAALQKGHHGHHHHHAKAAASTGDAASATSNTASDPTQLLGTTLNVTA